MVKMNHTDRTKIMQTLTKYQNPEMTRKEVCNVLQHYRSLQFNMEPFVFNDGSRKDLINLQGTIPISYKGGTYNIPVCLWLMDTHPNNAPMCFVRPTPDMSIKVSMFVDHNGKIYLPYLHDWVPHSSDLLSLIQVMSVMFGEQPPVFAKKGPNTQKPPTAYSPQPFMPVPMNGGASGTVGSGFPPYPTSSQYPGANPPYPAAGGSGMGYGGYGGMPMPHPSQNFPGAVPTPFNPASLPGENPYTLPSMMPGSVTPGNSDTITEEHIRASLLSAIGDKLRRRLCDQVSQLQAELETLRRTQKELKNGSSRLAELFNKLKKEKAELEKNINILQDKESELEREIGKLSDNQSIDVDEAVTTIAPLYKQMLNAFAEEAATEDAIYYLAEGLRSGIIDLDVFLKQVRQLSRRQFMLRALMLRCRQKAGLAG